MVEGVCVPELLEQSTPSQSADHCGSTGYRSNETGRVKDVHAFLRMTLIGAPGFTPR